VANYAYFAVFGTGGGLTEGIYKVDTTSFAETFLVGVLSPLQLSVTADDAKVYTTSSPGGDLYAYDTTSGSLLATIVCSPGSLAIDTSADNSRLYAIGGATPNVTVFVIDTTSDTIIATLSPPTFAAVPSSQHITCADDNLHAYLVGGSPVAGVYSYAVIDLATNTVTSFALPTTTASSIYCNMAVSQDATLGYVCMPNSTNTGNICVVIDLVGNTIVTTIPLTVTSSGSGANGYSVCDHLNQKVYCLQASFAAGQGRLSVIDVSTNTESYTQIGFGNVIGAALAVDGLHLFVGDGGSGNAAIWNTNTHALGGTDLNPTWGVSTQKLAKVGNPIVMIV
jgi:DNA-binding beta-propeller fold protein YncE